MTEVELKLALAAAQQRRFLAQPLLKQAVASTRKKLLNIYYDTPELELFRHGIALRLRRQGEQWLQTVKCAGEASGGLAARPEWETPHGGEFDFSAVSDPAVRKYLERLQPQLLPVFETNFLRITWRFEPRPSASLLLMLDRGWVAAGGRRETISEVEIELAGADTTELFALAHGLAERVTLVPALRSKAERGYRLFSATAEKPAKATLPTLRGEQSPLAAFRLIALACLEQIQANHGGVLDSDDPEYIHQMRVGARRLRAALRLFRPCLPADFAEGLGSTLRDLATCLGATRDLDVLQTETIAPIRASLPEEPRLAALAELVAARREAARQQTRQALAGRDYGRWLLTASGEIHHLADPAAPVYPTLAAFLDHQLPRLQRKVKRLARAARQNDPLSLHALRIGIKRLRYALDFFQPLLGLKASRLKPLAEAQEALGHLNDLASAGHRLEALAAGHAELREAVSLIGGWHAPRQAALLKRVPAVVEHLQRFRLPQATPPLP
ncbi:MAG TPA: CHAD domain-containing protein [Rhodocyclaceae bacterium]